MNLKQRYEHLKEEVAKMEKVDYKLNFKKELNDFEYMGIKEIISNLISDKDKEEYYFSFAYYNSPNTKHELPYDIGKPSEYALIGLNNDFEVEKDGFNYTIDHFSLTEDNKLIMICYNYFDEEEDDLCPEDKPIYFEVKEY